MSSVTSQVSHVACRLSPVTCHLLTATATDPPPDNFPIMHSRLVCKDLKEDIKQEQGYQGQSLDLDLDLYLDFENIFRYWVI